MNKEKIAKLIYELRKEKGLTQKELADKLYISDKAVSKWERAICLPDLTTFKELAKIFDISVAELISGEKISNDNKLEQIDEIYLTNLQKEKRKSHQKTRIILISIFIILICFFWKNYQRIYVYRFRGNTLHYHFANGLAIFSDKENIIELGQFGKDYNFPIEDDLIEKANITILIDQSEVYKSVYNKQKGSLEDWLDSLVINFQGNLNKNCQENCMAKDFTKLNKNNFPKYFKIVMEYCDTNKCFSDEFKIETEIIASNRF